MHSYFLLQEKISKNPYYNLAREEALCLHLHKHSLIGGLRFWENSHSIVLGLSDSVEKNVRPEVLQTFLQKTLEKKCKKKVIPYFTYIARRASGGGTVYQESQMNLNFSIFVNLEKRPELFNVQDSYDKLLGLVTSALSEQKIIAKTAGKSDISIIKENGELWKISGNAQFRKKNCIVHHGTLILNPELISKVEQTLTHPPQEPEYRKNRTHSKFITSLPSYFETLKFQKDLILIFQNFLGLESQPASNREFFRSVAQETHRLFLEKYSNKDFIFQKP